MKPNERTQYKSPTDQLFTPRSTAAKVLVPLLDALKWQGDMGKMIEALVDQADDMDTGGLVETMANLNFKYIRAGKVRGGIAESRLLPALLVQSDNHLLILNIEGYQALVFDGATGVYRQMLTSHLKGRLYIFQYAEDVEDSLIQPQNNWFNKLIYRFRAALSQLAFLTLFITLLDLLLPVFITLIYDRILLIQDFRPLLLTTAGILIYVISSFALNHLRDSVLNYISSRMGAIISLQTFTRLVYLSPNYTETASINSQISRLKDFENLKKFVTSGNFIALFDLAFSVIYIIAIFVIGGWIGIIPIITLVALIGTGLVMRPFYKIKMEKLSEVNAEKQQSLIEILKNVDEIKISSAKSNWINRFNRFSGAGIMNSNELSNYVSLTNSISYFITNISVLAVIYGGVLQVFDGRMSTGALIGVLMLYWKIVASIRSAFSLSVQINGLLKSIEQINRFMKLAQDSNLKTSMVATKDIRGGIRFADVSIRYSANANPALLNVNFSNAPGKILGITGHDGAGKTTILKLILGMYKPQGGKIFIDNANIKQLEPLSLRRSIGYCPEKDMILSGTLRDNFRSYNPSITDASILELAEKTGLKDYMTLFGYDLETKLTADTIENMSLSFKKLFNLTRMMAREAKLYLIDEPENHLDRAAIERVIQVFREMAADLGAGVIISTKDEQILKRCDNVIQLDQGRVISSPNV